MENNSNTETLQICRTCMKELVNKSLFFNLDFTHANTEPTIRQKLYECIAELDLNIVPNAVICYECADIVNCIYKFKKECFQTEMKIHKYIQPMQQADSVVDLVEVVQFYRQPYQNLRMELKTEAFEVIENFKADESTLCDSNICNEAGKHTEYLENEYLLSLQKIDLENVLFNTDDIFITYCKSQSKENSDLHDASIASNNTTQVVDKQDDYIHNVDTPGVMYQCYTCGHKTESKLKLIVHIKSHRAKDQHHETASKSCLRNNKSIKLEPIQKNYSIENNKVKCANRKGNSKYKNKRICQDSDSRNYFSQDTSSKSTGGKHMLKKPFKCSVCEYRCSQKTNLKRHIMLIHTAEKPFKCSICEYQCVTKTYLITHMRIHTGEKPFKCSVCKYQCTQKTHLKPHMRCHTGEKPFKCSICEYQCTQTNHLKIHMRIHTREKPFKCLVCEYQCITKTHLKIHMRIHSGEKPFKCLVCEYHFTQKTSLKTHMRIHTGEKPFKCSICEYRCSRKTDLKIHMRIHTGEKPFKCSVCDYQCTQKTTLKIHNMRSHTGEKPVNCSICEYKCITKNHLKSHMRIHTDEKPYKCSACEYQCRHKNSLKAHMRIHSK